MSNNILARTWGSRSRKCKKNRHFPRTTTAAHFRISDFLHTFGIRIILSSGYRFFLENTYAPITPTIEYYSMKKSSYYLLTGILALVLVILFYIFIKIRLPLLIIPAIILVIVFLVILRRAVSDRSRDERQILIDMKTAMLTMKTSIILFLVGNIPVIIYAFSVPPMIFPMPHFRPPETVSLIKMGYIALGELVLMAICIIMYGAFHIHYTHKYGGDIEETDNEE